MQSIITESAKETKKLAGELANRLVQRESERALVLALSGELGSGKTTFIKGFSKVLGVKERVLSPTFVLIHKHSLKNKNLYHIDAYRLESEKDLLKLDIKEIFTSPQNIVIIEWADRVKKIIPKNAIWIKLSHLKEKNKRRILID